MDSKDLETQHLITNRIYHEDTLLTQRTYNFLTVNVFLGAALIVGFHPNQQQLAATGYLVAIIGVIVAALQVALGRRAATAISFWRTYLRQAETKTHCISITFSSCSTIQEGSLLHTGKSRWPRPAGPSRRPFHGTSCLLPTFCMGFCCHGSSRPCGLLFFSLRSSRPTLDGSPLSRSSCGFLACVLRGSGRFHRSRRTLPLAQQQVPPNQRMDQSGRGRRLSRAGTTSRRTVTFPDRAAAPQVMRGR